MDSLKVLLDKFDAILRKYNPVNYNKLQNPLPKEKIDQYLKTFGINDESFKLLFTWKNGFDYTHGENPHKQVLKIGGLISLEYLLESRKYSYLWKDLFFPLICEEGGDYILFNNERTADYGKLHLYSVSRLFIDEPVSYYDSIYTMIDTTIKAYKEEILIFDKINGNKLKYDFKAYNILAAECNKNSEYWTIE